MEIGVPVRAGKNVVEFTYRPLVFWSLLILNRVTWLVLALLALVRIGRRFYSPIFAKAP